MKDSTRIWESSNRPLFVRTVWLESLGRTRPKLRRHFLLDYDSQKIWRKIKERPKSHYDNSNCNESFGDFTDDYISETEDENNDIELNRRGKYFYGQNKHQRLLLNSAKAKLHEPIELLVNNQQFRNFGNYKTFTKNLQIQEIEPQKCCSHCSSLLDLPSSSLTEEAVRYCDERLVERVLNWLDLAGTAGDLKPCSEVEITINNRYLPQSPKQKRSKLNSASKLTVNLKANSKMKISDLKDNLKSPTSTKCCRSDNYSKSNNNYKEEVFKMSSKFLSKVKATATIASNLVRLPLDSNATCNCFNRSLNSTTNNKSEKIKKSHKRCGLTSDLTNRMLRKHFQKECDEQILNPLLLKQNSPNAVVEARKQLHIFMPTLPKRTLDVNDYGYESQTNNNYDDY